MDFKKNELRIIKRIRHYSSKSGSTYDFWFVYNEKGVAIDYEGGYGLYNHDREKPTDKFTPTGNNKFRNQYSLTAEKKIIKNW